MQPFLYIGASYAITGLLLASLVIATGLRARRIHRLMKHHEA